MSDPTATAAFGEGAVMPGAGEMGAADVDTGTIAWLLPEIVQAFDQATAALRTFRAGAAGVERADVDLAPLRVARSHLHQAHGALELGEIAGVTRLTEAIEEFLAVFEQEPERCDATALDAIIGGCRAIVEYLEDLQGGARQQPMHLFPSYRDVLTARGVDRIHPADLFFVDLGVRPPRDTGGAALDRAGLLEQRNVFERGLLRYIRNESDASALANLCRAVTALDASVGRTATPAQSQQRAFWWATRALFDALANNGFATSTPQHAHLKRLAGRINLQIRKLVDGSNAVAERLFADTLFFVAIAAPVTQHVRDVQARYRLGGAVPDDFERQRYGRIDPAALKTARDAIGAAKFSWAGGRRRRPAGHSRIREAHVVPAGRGRPAAPPRAVAGRAGHRRDRDGARLRTAPAEAFGRPRRRDRAAVRRRRAGTRAAAGRRVRRARRDGRRAARGVGARTAASVDAGRLAGPHVARGRGAADGRGVRRASCSRTCAAPRRNSTRSSATRRRTRGLPEAQKALAQVSGALALLGHDDAHRAVDHARETIAGFLEPGTEPDPVAFEPLAQSLGAVGFYVDQIKRDRVDPTAFAFDAATGRFTAEIGRPAATQPPVEATDDFAATIIVADDDALPVVPTPEADHTYSEIAFAATQVLDSEQTLEQEIAHRAADARDHATRLRADPGDHALRDQLAAAVDDVRRNAALIDDRSLQDEAASLLWSLRRAAHEPLGAPAVAEIADAVHALAARADRSVGIAPPSVAPAEPVVAVPSADNIDAIDAELLGIFLEEGAGVLQDAEAAMRVLDADPQNTTATINLRRGFHTLKGSSRMVGLMAFGEAAWAIEDTLNGHIADQDAASTDLRGLIDYAIRYLSGWIAELHDSGHSSRMPDTLVEAARAVRAGGSPNAMAFATTEIIEPAPAPVETEAADDESFVDTLFAPTLSGDLHDRAYAATEVIGTEHEDELRFFGEQPQHRDGDAPMAREATSTTDEARSAEPAFDAAPPLEATATVDDATPSYDWLELSEPVAAAAPATDEALPLDDETADLMPALEVHAGAAHGDAEDVEASHGDAVHDNASHDDAVHGDASHVDASHDMPHADLVELHAGPHDVEPATVDNVVSFPLRETPVQPDDVRRIGPLTLSVALFNIYLTEADELLRILTTDLAEWRHEPIASCPTARCAPSIRCPVRPRPSACGRRRTSRARSRKCSSRCIAIRCR